MEEEIWVKVDMFQQYEVSNKGNVRSINYMRTGETVMLKQALRKGYCHVTLMRNGERHDKSVHWLVATAFIPNPEKKPFIDHINCKRDDNRVENLRWCTAKENQNNPITVEAIRKSKTGCKNPQFGRKLTEEQKRFLSEINSGEKSFWYGKTMSLDIRKRISDWHNSEISMRKYCRPVIQYDEDGNICGEWISVIHAARVLGVSYKSIRRCCLGGRRTYKGFIWKYAEDPDLIFDKYFSKKSEDSSPKLF